MSQRSKQVILYCILCVVASLNLTFGASTANQTIENPVIVFFDEAHGQYFNHSLYSKALSDLTRNGMELIINNDTIDRTTLDGVDIFVSTNPKNSFTFEERHYISEYLKQGKSMFLLANPLNEENDSLNGRSHFFNDIINYASPNIGLTESVINFWVDSEDSSTTTDVVKNEFSNAGISSYLLLNINSSDHDILSLDQNVTSIITYTCSIRDAQESIILASPEAFTKTAHNPIHTYASDITVVGSIGPLDNGARILLSGSSLMFSDLNDSIVHSSWYESENNSILWKNIFKWLADIEAADTPQSFSSIQTLLILFVMATVATVFLLAGGMFYSIGSGQKVEIIKTGEHIIPESEEKPLKPKKVEKPVVTSTKAPSRPTKRERRLQQIKKQPKRKKK
ncbi:MAG: hypothetical protein ACFE95_12895 [Candidatus Hodarchaeota archaeon]